MRILTICYEYPPLGGGGASAVESLCQALVNFGHEVEVLTMAYRKLPATESRQGVKIHRIPCVRTSKHICYSFELAIYLLKAFPRLVNLIKTRQFDLLHAHFILPDGLLASWAKRSSGLPLVVTAHGTDVPGYNPDRFLLEHKLLAPVWRKVVKQIDRLIFPSQHLQRLFSKSCPQKESEIIPNCRDENFVIDFDPSGPVQRASRILVVSRMFERKGVQFLIHALSRFESQDSRPYQIDIVGDGPYLNKLHNLSVKLCLKIKFWNWLDRNSSQLAKLFKDCGIFVLTSEAENFPVVLLEAMAAGMAIITTVDTGCAEVVGDAAILVRSRDSEEIFNALSYLLGNVQVCSQLGLKARERFETYFTPQSIASRYIGVYQNLLDDVTCKRSSGFA